MGMYAKYLVCYDIVDNKRRKRFSDALKDLGMVPMQKSVFYGDLKGAEVSCWRTGWLLHKCARKNWTLAASNAHDFGA